MEHVDQILDGLCFIPPDHLEVSQKVKVLFPVSNPFDEQGNSKITADDLKFHFRVMRAVLFNLKGHQAITIITIIIITIIITIITINTIIINVVIAIMTITNTITITIIIIIIVRSRRRQSSTPSPSTFLTCGPSAATTI